MKLLFATHNLNKVNEARKILKGIDLISLSDLNDMADVEEVGKSFKENAYLKAKYYYDKYKIPTFSDDSGLCCLGLDLFPGINSKRIKNNDEENIKEIWRLLASKDKAAYFEACVCLIIDDETYFFKGILEGEIILEKRGAGGFGYDPIFYLEEYGKTLAELGEEKNKISHRSKALSLMASFLEDY
ncbi:MAG TPA: RdgB/HAM1 family non-canonical purine NTP pyrophosphatase [Acholeplasma sp.]|nr:RdgB/HAM1 family non-canonical purine NTP pyrophosphatase [Acholeplasma sp.]